MIERREEIECAAEPHCQDDETAKKKTGQPSCLQLFWKNLSSVSGHNFTWCPEAANDAPCCLV